jgi:hypothetical protein
MLVGNKRTKLTIRVTVDDYHRLGADIMRRCPESGSEVVFERRWMSFFGVDAVVCVDTWTRIGIDLNNAEDPADKSAEPVHLLWALLFLKQYGTEAQLAAHAGAVDEKTFRKWSHLFVKKRSYLMCDVVSFCKE